MRVAFDTSVTDLDPGGITRYVEAVVAALRADPNGIDLVPISMFAEWPWTRRLERHLKVIAHDQLWVPKGMVAAARRLDADIVHGGAFKVAPVTEPAASVTIHDDTPWDQPPTASLYNRLNLRRTLRTAAPVVRGALVSTDITAAAVLRHLPDLEGKIFVTPFGIDHGAFRPVPQHVVDRARQQYGILGRPYVLMVGPYGPRKNFAAMTEALTQARHRPPDLGVVVTGRPAASARSAMPVISTGFVDDPELAALYSGAEFLFYASTSEGFGFPVLEAMACGCPVVTSRGTVLEELGGTAAVLVDPRDVGDMAAGCDLLLGDAAERKLRAALGMERASTFSWALTAEASADAWRAMA
jgi:glycosyltransferase involved in cell wall biosynthesis